MKGTRARELGASLSPVFVYEFITFARCWQGYVLRSFFLLILLGALVVIWNGAGVTFRFPIRAMAQIGESFYIAAAGTKAHFDGPTTGPTK